MGSSRTNPKKRTASQADVSGETSQAKRADTQLSVKPTSTNISPKPPKQYLYAVVRSSIYVYTGDYYDKKEGTEHDEETLAIYSDLEDANRRVIREYKEWDGEVVSGEGNKFIFHGPENEWFIDAGCEEEGEGVRVVIKKMRVFGSGSEPKKERERLIPGEDGFDDQEWEVED